MYFWFINNAVAFGSVLTLFLQFSLNFLMPLNQVYIIKNEVCVVFIIRFLLLNITVKKSVTVSILSWLQTLLYLALFVGQQHVCWKAGVCVCVCVCVCARARARERETKIFQETDSCRCNLSVMYQFQDAYFLKKNSQRFVFPICLKTVLICAFSQFECLLVWWNCVEWIPDLCHGALFNCSIRLFIVWLQIICTAHSSYCDISFAKCFTVCRNHLL